MKKEVLILLHGGPGFDDSYFYPYLEDLESSFELASYCVGHTINDYTLAQMVEELENFIKGIGERKINILAHSFSAVLIMNIKKKIFEGLNKVILSNWIYDNKWIEIFNNSFPESSNFPQADLKSSSLNYLSYYFINKDEGRKVLEKMVYYDEIFNASDQILESLDLENILSERRSKLTSISSSHDNITPDTYIQKICKKVQINNYMVLNAGHFPFVDNPTEFQRILRNIINL